MCLHITFCHIRKADVSHVQSVINHNFFKCFILKQTKTEKITFSNQKLGLYFTRELCKLSFTTNAFSKQAVQTSLCFFTLVALEKLLTYVSWFGQICVFVGFFFFRGERVTHLGSAVLNSQLADLFFLPVCGWKTLLSLFLIHLWISGSAYDINYCKLAILFGSSICLQWVKFPP